MMLKIINVFLCVIYSCSALKLVKLPDTTGGITGGPDTGEPGGEPNTTQTQFKTWTPNQHPQEAYPDFKASVSDRQYDREWARKAGLLSTQQEEAMNATLSEIKESTGGSKQRNTKGLVAICPPICYNRVVLMYQWKLQLSMCQHNKCYGGGHYEFFEGGVFVKFTRKSASAWSTCALQQADTDVKAAWRSYTMDADELNGSPPACGVCYEKKKWDGIPGETTTSSGGTSASGVEFRYACLKDVNDVELCGQYIVWWGSKSECEAKKAATSLTYWAYRYRQFINYPARGSWGTASACVDAKTFDFKSGSPGSTGTPGGNNHCETCKFDQVGPWGMYNIGMPDCSSPP